MCSSNWRRRFDRLRRRGHPAVLRLFGRRHDHRPGIGPREIESWPLVDPAEFWQRALPLLGHDRFALAALDAAAHDLWGKKLGQPRIAYGGWIWTACRRAITRSASTRSRTRSRLREFDGWPVYKIKLGTPDDLEIVRELRRHTAAAFRVDANCAWTAEQTIATPAS